MTSGISLRNEHKVGSTFETKSMKFTTSRLKRKTTVSSQKVRKRHLTKFIIHL